MKHRLHLGLRWLKRHYRWGLAALLLPCGFLLITWWRVQAQVVLQPTEATLLLEDRQGRFLSEGEGATVGFWPVSGDLQRIEHCFLAIEDHRFWDHGGVDVHALGRAFFNNLNGASRQGGSTIAMQVARMQQQGPRTYRKKLEEVFVARGLTRTFGRRAVLDQYLTIVPMGNRIHGVAYAARRYFRKPLVDLSWAEAAVLAALPQAPSDMNLFRRQGLIRARERAKIVLARVHQLAWMNDDEYHVALSQLSSIGAPIKEARPFHSVHAILRIQEEARGLAYDRPVRTSLDLDVQDQVDQLAYQHVSSYRGLGAGNVAAIVLDVTNGEVLAYVGSAFYDDVANGGRLNYARIPRSTGSVLKPFLFAYAMETGCLKPQEILADLPIHLVHPSGQYTVSNYDDDYLGPLLVRRALANSRNIPAVALMRRVGSAQMFTRFQQLRLADQNDHPEAYGLGTAVGGLYCSLEQVVGAYTALANDGKQIELKWFRDQEVQATDVMPADIARLISLFLSDPQARLPSFPRKGPLEYQFPVAVKTGTSQGFRDAWCVAYSSRYLVGAWLGDKDWQKMNRVGGLVAARLVHQIFEALEPEASVGVATVPFEPPSSLVATNICAWTGLRATESCASQIVEYVSPDLVGECAAHVKLAIDRETGEVANEYTPTDQIVSRDFLNLAPEYAVWAARRNLAPPPKSQRGPIRLAIQSPSDGSRIASDPETPTRFQSIALRAEVEPKVAHIEWWVNGKLFQTAAYPYEVRLPLSKGSHQIQARLPKAFVASDPVQITMQ
ncbi:MAG: transglycosylase domain-containing protein [Acidobacteria bacterium]|nr:transglycosylase domain-containing protein [Acidobacteriota bacterium]